MVNISSKSLKMVIDFPYYLKYDKFQALKVYYSAIKWSNMKISTRSCFTCISWEVGYSPALINIRTFVAKRVNTRFLRSFCGSIFGRWSAVWSIFDGYSVFFWWSVFDKTPVPPCLGTRVPKWGFFQFLTMANYDPSWTCKQFLFIYLVMYTVQACEF